MKYPFMILIIAFVVTACTPIYVNTEDDVLDEHEQKIKETIMDDDEFNQEFITDMEIILLGEIKGYYFYQIELPENEAEAASEMQSYEHQGVSFPGWTKSSVKVIQGSSNKYFPLEGVLHGPLFFDEAEVVLELIVNHESYK